MPSFLSPLPVNLVTFAALMTVIFLLGRHRISGTIRIFLRGTAVLVVVILVAHFFSAGEISFLDRLISSLRKWLEL